MGFDDDEDDEDFEGYGGFEDDEVFDAQDEAEQTGLPVGTCGYCGGAHYITEHMTDGEIAREARDAEREGTDFHDGE